jgi:hypothetical protein
VERLALGFVIVFLICFGFFFWSFENLRGFFVLNFANRLTLILIFCFCLR